MIERKKPKFSKKLLGKKTRTRMVGHRICIKFYEYGITIRPLGTQGENKEICPIQSELFLTGENVNYLKRLLDDYYTTKEILDNLNEEVKT
jgi:hypothetical protein